MAAQFGFHYPAVEDGACTRGSGKKPPYDSTCRTTPNLPQTTEVENVFGSELPCIFPFYFNNRLYNSCAVLETNEFLVPVWRCPVYNITTKTEDGINDFGSDGDAKYCIDRSHLENTCYNDDFPYFSLYSPTCERQVDPRRNCDYRYPYNIEVSPFATCKTDCLGGKFFYLPKYKLLINLS